MKKIMNKEFIMEQVNWVIMWVTTFYGITFTTVCGFNTLLSDSCKFDRLEMVIMMTAVPSMIYGLRKLRDHWIAQYLSKRATEETELTLATAA